MTSTFTNTDGATVEYHTTTVVSGKDTFSVTYRYSHYRKNPDGFTMSEALGMIASEAELADTFTVSTQPASDADAHAAHTGDYSGPEEVVVWWHGGVVLRHRPRVSLVKAPRCKCGEPEGSPCHVSAYVTGLPGHRYDPKEGR